MSVATALLALIVVLWLIYGPLPTLYCKYLRDNSLPAGSADSGKRLLLTFDDGPDRQYTPQLLRVLAENRVPAVFFVLGAQAAHSPELVEQMGREGHGLGFHGRQHRDMWFMGRRATREELRVAAEFLTAHSGSRLFRPPYGHVNLASLYYTRKYRLHVLLWTVMIRDWQLALPETLADRLRVMCRDGSVVCLHDCGIASGGEPGAPARTVGALDSWLPEALAAGYSFIDGRNLP